MKVSAATSFLLAAAMGVSAHPSGHAHMHRSAVEKRTNFVKAYKPVIEAPAPVTSEEPKQTAASVPKPKEEVKASNIGSGSGSSSGFKPFCKGNTKRVIKRATLDEIAYTGNVGSDGDYGCNLMLIDNDVADKYKYTTTFNNESGDDQKCVCFLKIGPKGLIDGFFNGNEALSFDLPAGGSKVVAADENTQGGCTCDSGKVPLTKNGQFAATWLEFDFGNESNGGWSGADASCLVAAAHGMDIPGLNVCGHGTCSTINPGGTGENAFLGGMEALDGLGLNLPAGEARLEVTVGYSG
jgi:hypothetical protein